MTREDIIRMAHEVGFSVLMPSDDVLNVGGVYPGYDDEISKELQHFAQLVAAAEREAIVQMIENVPALLEFATNDQGGCLVCGFTPKLAIAAIRARGNKT